MPTKAQAFQIHFAIHEGIQIAVWIGFFTKLSNIYHLPFHSQYQSNHNVHIMINHGANGIQRNVHAQIDNHFIIHKTHELTAKVHIAQVSKNVEIFGLSLIVWDIKENNSLVLL